MRPPSAQENMVSWSVTFVECVFKANVHSALYTTPSWPGTPLNLEETSEQAVCCTQ